jgi:hypothetical protein
MLKFRRSKPINKNSINFCSNARTHVLCLMIFYAKLCFIFSSHQLLWNWKFKWNHLKFYSLKWWHQRVEGADEIWMSEWIRVDQNMLRELMLLVLMFRRDLILNWGWMLSILSVSMQTYWKIKQKIPNDVQCQFGAVISHVFFGKFHTQSTLNESSFSYNSNMITWNFNKTLIFVKDSLGLNNTISS